MRYSNRCVVGFWGEQSARLWRLANAAHGRGKTGRAYWHESLWGALKIPIDSDTKLNSVIFERNAEMIEIATNAFTSLARWCIKSRRRRDLDFALQRCLRTLAVFLAVNV